MITKKSFFFNTSGQTALFSVRSPHRIGGIVFVNTVQGRSRVIITVPHDGWLHFDAPVRAEVLVWRSKGCTDPRDVGTLAVANHIQRSLGKEGRSPTVIFVTAHRAHVDVNRAPNREPYVTGFQQTYRAFHDQVDHAIERACFHYGNAIVIDLHGFVRYADPGETGVVLGTRNGATSPRRIDLHIAGRLHQHGIPTVCSPDETRQVEGIYRGGWTVERIAKDWRQSVDSVQIELHEHHRASPEQRVYIAHHLARAVSSII